MVTEMNENKTKTKTQRKESVFLRYAATLFLIFAGALLLLRNIDGFSEREGLGRLRDAAYALVYSEDMYTEEKGQGIVFYRRVDAEDVPVFSFLDFGESGEYIDYYNASQSVFSVLPVEGTVTSGFCERKNPFYGTSAAETDETEFHPGVDIAAPLGTPIYACRDGVVAKVNYSAGYGNYIIIDHGGGMETLYAHASIIVAAEGMSVQAGDVIAKVGSTGRSTGPHLHFELHRDAKAQDPAPYLASLFEKAGTNG